MRLSLSPLSLLFYTLFLLLLGILLFPFSSSASGIFEDNFDTYSVGSVCTQAGNASTVGAFTCPNVTSATSVTSNNSIVFHSTPDTQFGVDFSGNASSTGKQSFWLYGSSLQQDLTTAVRWLNIGFYGLGTPEFSVTLVGDQTSTPHNFLQLRPTSTKYFNIPFSTWVNIEFEWTNTQYRMKYNFSEYSPWLNRASNGIVDTIRLSSSGNPDQGMVFIDSFEFIPQNYLAELSFTSPVNEDFLQSGEQVISGTCKNIGTNQLFIFNRFITDPLESYFTVECESDYTWSTTYDLENGNHELWIFDKDFLSLDIKNQNTTTTKNISYTGFNASSTDYQLGIVYPTTSNGSVYEVQYSDDFPFQFAYTLPSYDLGTSTRFILEQYTDSTYTSVASSIANNSIEFFDFDYVGRFTIQNGIVATTSPTYYEASLWEDNFDTLAYKIRFQVVGTSSPSAPAPTAPDVKDCGLICNSLRWAFVPSRRFFHDYSVELPQLLSSAIPFSYFYQVKDILNAQSVSSDNFALSFYYKNNSSSTIDVFDPQNSTVQEFSAGFRPFIIYGLWIMFCLYLVVRVMDFHI